MLIFPIQELMDEPACYDFLRKVLHPEGLRCPQGHDLPPDQGTHDRHRAPIVDYRCRACGTVYNLFTGTIWSKSRYSCSTIVMILRGIAQGVPTRHLAKELRVNRPHLLQRRHQIQGQIEKLFFPAEAVKRRGDGSRRNVPECRGKGPETRGPRRPPAPTREQSTGSRDL